MSDRKFRSMLRPDDERDLSALVDGELSADRERELRQRMLEEPELSERCAELAEMDGALHRLAGSELDAERLARMHQGLRARINADASETIDPDPVGARILRFPVLPRVVYAAAALAAAVALYLALGTGSGPAPDFEIAQGGGPSRSLPEAVVAPEVGEPSLLAEVNGLELADSGEEAPTAASEETLYPSEETMEDLQSELQPELQIAESVEWAAPTAGLPEPVLLDGDEELAIALEYETFADFDVISNLGLLEALSEFDNLESM